MRAMEVIFGLDSVGIGRTSREIMWLGTAEENARVREEKRGLKSDFSLERRREKMSERQVSNVT